ncbi:hypothetical protein OCH239_16690 [Roseivivax halodurans JCM 10272]|uniref:Uncharacterized protein n=1 Tax=Roseivivax halodurans JCM 10272 TaxID=1449350 RepID=X7EHE9_9RHOB|nr:YtxH domain-containing protein [Roseivivax halodurans]ETX15504.1 hypothetical protein OCH239_16690 [Roseivivax halodurans JCM 10272]
MAAFLGAVVGMVLGIVAGIFLAPVSDRITEVRKRRNLIRHIRYDLENAARHFGYVSGELHSIWTEPSWKRYARFQWMKFSSRGFLTSSRVDLYALDDAEADLFMELLVLFENFDELCGVGYALSLHDSTRAEPLDDAEMQALVAEIERRSSEITTKIDRLRGVVAKAMEEWRWWHL